MGVKDKAVRNWAANKWGASWLSQEWNRPGGKFWMIAMVAIAILSLVAIIWLLSSQGSNPSSGATTVSAKESESTPAKTSTCSPEFTQVELNRSNYEVDPRYEKEVRPILMDNNLNPKEKATKIKQVELKLAGTNAETLAAWVISSPVLDYDNKNLNWHQLVEGGKIVNGGCLSEKGKQVWSEFKGSISASLTAGPGQSNGTETNSGIENSTYVQAEVSGVSVDRTAVVYTFADGSTWKKLVVCGNPLYDKPHPELPKGKTVNPPPKEEPPTLEPKRIEEAPQRQGNLPVQQMPNPLPRQPEHYQPTKPVNPPQTYVPPTKPAPAPPSGPSAPKPAQPAPGPATPVEPNPTPITEDPEPGPGW